MAAVISFMESPLVTWVRTFGDEKDPVDFQEICDGVFLNDVMGQIDQRDLDLELDLKRAAKDINARIQNWALLMKNIYNYYQDVLQQIVVMETPDIVAIAKDPTKESSLSHARSVLLLILGCAVQCDHKEDYINVIKSLDVGIQQAMVSCIQEVTDNCENIVDIDGTAGEKQLIGVVKNVTEERNTLAQHLLTITQERDYYKQELVDKRGGQLTPPVHLERYQLQRELTDWKNKCGGLEEETEEKSKTISDLQEDLDEVREQYLKLKTDNVGLSRDAKAVQSYRDELDALREKSLKLERCEKDIAKYKERLGELDFFKSRVEELRKDNDAVVESRSHTEDQLSTCQKRLDSAMEELVRAQMQVDESNMEKEQLNKKLHELIDENAMLEFEKSKIKEGYGSTNIRRIMSITSMDLGSQQHLAGHSISDELQDSMSSQMTRIEMERDELKQELDDAKQRLYEAQLMLKKVQDETEKDIQRKMAEMEHQTKRMRSQTSKELSDEYHQKIEEIEHRSVDLKRRMSEEYKVRFAQLEKDKKEIQEKNADLSKQVSFIKEAWKKDKEKCIRLERSHRDLAEEKEQFKLRFQIIQESSGRRIQELEDEVDCAKHESQSLKDRNFRVCNLCKKEINGNNVTQDSENETNHLNSLQGLDIVNGMSPIMSSSICSESRPMLVSKGSQTSPPPAWISYSEEGQPFHPLDMRYHDENRNKKSGSSTKSKFLDILRPKSNSGRQGSPVPSRPITVLGVVNENRSASLPMRGVATSQRRSVPNTPERIMQEPFRRNDKMRSTIHHGGSSHTHHHHHHHHHQQQQHQQQNRSSSNSQHSSPSSDYAPFSRGDRLRSTMPEKLTGYVAPERRLQVGSSSSRSSVCSMESNRSFKYSDTDLDSSILAYLDRAMCPPDLSRENLCPSDKDSGCPTSPDTPTTDGPPQTPTRDGHQLTSFKVISSESVKTQIRTSTTLPKMGESWRALVDKIVELQNKNQKLLGDNSDMRKSLNSIKFSSERVDVLEKRNLEIEVENRKLRKIVDSLQSTLEGLNPYDKRTYHYYSNV